MAGGLSLCPDVKRAARPAGSVFLGSTRVLLRDPLRSPRAQHPLRPISRAGSPLRPGRTGSTVRQRAILWGFRSAAIPGQRELGRPPPGPPARNLNTVKRVGQPDGERRLEQPAARPAVSPVFFFSRTPHWAPHRPPRGAVGESSPLKNLRRLGGCSVYFHTSIFFVLFAGAKRPGLHTRNFISTIIAFLNARHLRFSKWFILARHQGVLAEAAGE